VERSTDKKRESNLTMPLAHRRPFMPLGEELMRRLSPGLAGAKERVGSVAHGDGSRSRVVLVGPLMLHGRVLSVPRSCVGISVSAEEVRGHELGGFRAPMRVGRTSIRHLTTLAMVPPMLHYASIPARGGSS
jgi:hypothetical protein